MKVALASDHRGFKQKSHIAQFLKERGYDVVDFGTHSPDPCDYPDYTYLAAASVQSKQCERAIIICYTGIGSCIAANKVRGIRAALAYSIKSASMSRRHNNSNVLVLPSHFFNMEYAKKVIARWLTEEFEGGRHQRRVRKIHAIEERESARKAS